MVKLQYKTNIRGWYIENQPSGYSDLIEKAEFEQLSGNLIVIKADNQIIREYVDTFKIDDHHTLVAIGEKGAFWTLSPDAQFTSRTCGILTDWWFETEDGYDQKSEQIKAILDDIEKRGAWQGQIYLKGTIKPGVISFIELAMIVPVNKNLKLAFAENGKKYLISGDRQRQFYINALLKNRKRSSHTHLKLVPTNKEQAVAVG